MKRTNIYISLGLFGIAALVLYFMYASTHSTSLNPAFNATLAGVFDRRNHFPENLSRNTEHVSLTLVSDASKEELAQLFGKPVKDNLLVTVVIDDKNSLGKVTDGDYDDAIRGFARALPKIAGKIYVRWNPEMEVPVQLYTWQYQSPVDYIKAYRRFAAICKKANQAVQLVWAPAGYPGTEEYWPGGDVVDVVSITINGQSEEASKFFPRDKDAVTMIRRKLLRTRFADKPVIILDADNAEPSAGLRESITLAAAGIEKDAALVFQHIPNNTPPGRPDGAKPLIGVYDPKKLLVRVMWGVSTFLWIWKISRTECLRRILQPFCPETTIR
jgi:hypothetical protein